MGLILNYRLERGLEGLQELDESIDLSPVTDYVELFQDYRFHEGEVVELESGETYRITDRLPGLTAIRDENVYREKSFRRTLTGCSRQATRKTDLLKVRS